MATASSTFASVLVSNWINEKVRQGRWSDPSEGLGGRVKREFTLELSSRVFIGIQGLGTQGRFSEEEENRANSTEFTPQV